MFPPPLKRGGLPAVGHHDLPHQPGTPGEDQGFLAANRRGQRTGAERAPRAGCDARARHAQARLDLFPRRFRQVAVMREELVREAIVLTQRFGDGRRNSRPAKIIAARGSK